MFPYGFCFRRLDKWIVFKQRGTSIEGKEGISEDKKSFFIKRLSTSPSGKTSPNQKAEKEKPITLVVAEKKEKDKKAWDTNGNLVS